MANTGAIGSSRDRWPITCIRSSSNSRRRALMKSVSHNSSVLTFCGVVLAMVAIAGPGRAQSPKDKLNADSVACAEGSAMASYSRCALMLDGNKVRRGIEATEVGRPGFFAPIPMERLVAGDSAKKYAARYALRSKQAMWIGTIGAAALSAGLILAHNESHLDCLDAFCSRDD